MHGVTKLFVVIALFSLPTVMFGGFSLLRLIQRQRGLSQFQLTWFRAGHAHAGVLLILALVVLDITGQAGLGTVLQWTIGLLLVVGVLAQSGGMFLHMAIGEPGTWSTGNTVTTIGAVVLAAALVTTAIGVIAN
jgi:hypothetical protein